MRQAVLMVLAVSLAACSNGASAAPSSPSQLHTSVRDVHPGQVIDGVPCLSQDLPSYHIHVHLEMLLDGVNVPVPAGIGVGRPWGTEPDGFVATGSCFAWMHTHDATGLIHIVTPDEKTFTLGQFFELWGQPLELNGALGYRGSLHLLVNGDRIAGDPRALPLVNLENIVIELGRLPAVPPPALYDFAGVRR